MDYTTDGLITALRDLVNPPTWEDGVSAKLLRMLNREQAGFLTRLLLGARQEYRTATLSITLSASRTDYAIPPRAVSSGLKMIQAADASGQLWMLHELPAENVTWPSSWQSPCGQFFLRGNRITFYTAPTYSSLLVTYNRRLSELVLSTDTANARAITAINTGTKTVTMAGSISGSTFDLVQANPQFDLLTADAAGTPSGSTVVFASTLPVDLAVGDYCCVPQKAPICMAPFELHQVLAQRVAFLYLVAIGDPKAETSRQSLVEMTQGAMRLLAPRPTKVRAMVNPNAPGVRWPLGAPGRWWR